MTDLTISIVSYNTKDLLRRCLESVFKHTQGISFKVIVIDNASRDGSAVMVKREFPQVKLIHNRRNRFYTAANNQSLKLARSRYFLILNSDIFLTTNAFKQMINYLDKHPQVGAIEPLQLDLTGKIISTGSRHNTILTDFYELTWIGRQIKNQSLLHWFRLASKNRRHTWLADVIADAALMIRTDLFRSLGGYNQNLKLYYTENDLCRRLQHQGFQTVHFGQVLVKHTVSASTNLEHWQSISHIYATDAWHYYRRWHGFIPAALLYLILELNLSAIDLIKNKRPFILIFFGAAILRLWRLPSLMPFIGDFGHDYLAAKDLLTAGKIPLIGIASSVPWLYQGSLWIYLTALALWLGHFHPVAPAILAVILSLTTLWAITALAWKFWGKLAALISGLIFATSPLAVVHARLPWHTSPIPLAAIGYFYFLLRHSLFWSALFMGLLFQFELSNAPLILLLLWRFRLKHLKISLIGFSLPLLPKIVYDLTHNFSQIGGFTLWLGYRIAAFFGFRQIHTVSFSRLVATSYIIFDYLKKFFSWGSSLPAVFIIGFIIWNLIQAKKPIEKLLVYWLLIIIISFYVHGTPSESYFPVLFPFLSLTVGWGIGELRSTLIRRLAITNLILLVVFNSLFLWHRQFLTYGLPLSQRLAITDRIITNAQSRPFRLIGVGEGSQHASFLDNYRYLLWWRGYPEQPDTAQLNYLLSQ